MGCVACEMLGAGEWLGQGGLGGMVALGGVGEVSGGRRAMSGAWCVGDRPILLVHRLSPPLLPDAC